MKTFALHPKMLTLSGVFYPTGYAVIMFPDAQQAEQAARELVSGGYDDDAIMLLPPETILREIGRVDGDSDVDLPSVGTEGATVQKYIKLARQGQHGLMVHAASDKDTERVMSVVRTLPFSYAQKYHILAMEDLE
ncbi:MAG: RNA-binding protein [Polaromonas sp.]|nr:RNA-binding protein [Polaromonas sp.]